MVRPELPQVCPSCRTLNPADVTSCGACAQSLAASSAPASLLSEQNAISPAIPPLKRWAEEPFVGREQEMALLRAGLDEVCSGHGRVLLLTGEPGIGKTRIVNELATYARQRNIQVLPGRCYEGEGAPPFWPWVQIVRAYMTDCDLATLRTEMGPGAADIALVFLEVRERLADLPSPSGLGSEQARFRSFDSFATFLKHAAQRQPLMLILEDLHWADAASLLLLQFVVQEISGSRLLIVGTYRDLAFGRAHPLTQALGEIVRAPGSQSLALSGLSQSEVSRFIASATGQPPAEVLVTSLYKATEGNPFFLTEVVHLLLNESNRSLIPTPQSFTPFPIPQGVRAAIGRRLQRLSPACQQTLTLAAVIGREFALDVLEAVGVEFSHTPSGDRLLETLEEATAARIVTPAPRGVSRYSFSHALIRETLYEELSPVRRVRLHRQIAGTLERLHATRSEAQPSPRTGQVLAELSYHFSQAAQDGHDVEKALTYAARAGEQAMAALAYEEAVLDYQRALQILEFSKADQAQHCELLLALGAAQRKAGEITAARDTFQQAATLARTLGAPKGNAQAAALLARAALGFGGEAWIEYGTVIKPLVALLEEALDALDAEESALRARVLGRLAVALFYLTDEQEKRAMLSQQAVEMARRVGDTVTLAYALHSRHWALWGDVNVEERLTVATEIVRLAEQTSARELALTGRAWRIADLLELGEIETVDQEIAVFARSAATLRQPLYLWWTLVFRAMRALLDGRFTEAEQLARQAVAMGQRVHPQAPAQVFGIQLVSVLRQQGRLKELEVTLTQLLAQQLPSVIGQRIGLTVLYSELGSKAEAQREFAALAAHEFAELPRDQAWLVNIALLAQVCVFLADTQHATTLYEFLWPYRGRTIVGGHISATICIGATSRYLGLLAALLFRWQEAEQHFTDALALNLRLGAQPFVAHTQHEYASMLLVRNQPGDREKALELLHRALATAHELGMKSLEDKIQFAVRDPQSVVPEGEQQERKGEKNLRAKVQGWEAKNQSSQPPNVQTRDAQPQALDARPPVPDFGHRTSDIERQNVFRREGAYWTVAYQGQVCRLKDAKGLHYLATLLRHPGQEFHVIDLAGGRDLRPTPPSATVPKNLLGEHLHLSEPGDAEVRLDAQARIAYQRRLEDLRNELEEAERFHDLARVDKARTERDFISRELAVAYGLHGRARKRGSSSEKARQAVSYCIRGSLNKIRAMHPPLWRHLFAALKTGIFCSYNPEHPTSWKF